MHDQTKAIVTVSEMARMCGLSRARFYQLVQAGVFPPAVYDVSNRRPIYVEEMQKICLEVRRRNCGVNGKPVLFYCRGGNLRPSVTKGRKRKPKTEKHADLINALVDLGISVTAAQVGQAVKELFANGIEGTDQAEVVRAVFLRLKRQDSGDNVG